MDSIDKNHIMDMEPSEFEKLKAQLLKEDEERSIIEYKKHRIKTFLTYSLGLNEKYKNIMLLRDVDNKSEEFNSALREIVYDLASKKQFSSVLYGPAGVGKTHNAVAMMWEFINYTSLPVYFLSMQSAQRLITSSWTNNSDKIKLKSVIDFATKAPLLIIDDLGAEVPSYDYNKPVPPHVNKFLYEIGEARRNSDLPIIITSNLQRNVEMVERDNYKVMYDERTTSRLLPKSDYYWLNMNLFEDRRS